MAAREEIAENTAIHSFIHLFIRIQDKKSYAFRLGLFLCVKYYLNDGLSICQLLVPNFIQLSFEFPFVGALLIKFNAKNKYIGKMLNT